MAVFAIGDVQGCFAELLALLEMVDFNPDTDQLWFAGDLVNRGPNSLETLRFVRDLGPAAVTVLGNHDLHLLAAAYGFPLSKDDHTLDAILQAADRDTLIEWLRRQPLLHHDDSLGYTMVHAGLPPQWDLQTAQQCAREVETVLQSAHLPEFLEHMKGKKPAVWSADLEGWDRLRFIVNCFTRIRYCSNAGQLEFKSKGPPGTQKEGYYPWFDIPARASRELNIIFGHWSTLGPRDDPGIYPVDSACLWGGRLTALRIDSGPQRFELPCEGKQTPNGQRNPG